MTFNKPENTDFKDLQNELIGNVTGLQTRFLGKNSTSMTEAEKQKEKHKKEMDRLIWMLTHNKKFSEAYHKTMNVLEHAETIAENAIEQGEERLSFHKETIKNIHKNAMRLSDDSIVFKDKHGNIRLENGTILTNNALIENIDWKDQYPTYEEYVFHKKSISDIENNIYEWREYQVDVLANVRKRMMNKENIVNIEEVEALHKQMLTRSPQPISDMIEETYEANVFEKQAAFNTPMPDILGL